VTATTTTAHEPSVAAHAGRPAGIVARGLHAAVRAYRAVTAARPSPCRYDPTCSAFALEALEHHGALRGTWLTVRRLSRCHPWGGQGWDPVPTPHEGKV
jgi:putative membrane protein insertion efficiency factor